MKTLVIFGFTCFLSITTRGQENPIRWNEKKPLQWNDFTGEVNDTSWFDAECFAEVSYHYQFNSLTSFQFDVVANFIRNISWIKKEYQSEALLKHEQLHFDIAELFSLRLKGLFENYNYTEDFEYEIQLLFDEKKREYQLMQRQYDEETNHSRDKKKQKEWESYISSELTKMKLMQQIASGGVTVAKE